MLELMKMAQEFEIPVLVSATIERSIKSDEFSFLQLRDLYNCCLYEQYASVIMFLENPIYYDTKLDTMSEINGVVNLRISKNEIGNLGVIKMVPKLSIQKFCDYSHPII
jgi:replicative DNA helicase